MRVEGLEALFRIGHIVERFRDDRTPTSQLSFIIRSPAGSRVERHLSAKSRTKSIRQLIRRSPAAEATANGFVCFADAGIRQQQSAARIEENEGYIIHGGETDCMNRKSRARSKRRLLRARLLSKSPH